ncbi:MAG TPA: hypothetical protein VM074_06680 [Solimonas sp.]|nr:hypothetical protein [Solimonas sp.]
MKRFIPLLLLLGATSAMAEVGVSVTIGQPGFYGTIDIGGAPQPRLVFAEPIIVTRPAVIVREPLYLRVPPGHAKHWDKHCHEYNACSRQTYFVDDDWYETVYAPHYREVHGKGGHDQGGHGNGHGHGDKGHGKGHGKGKHK